MEDVSMPLQRLKDELAADRAHLKHELEQFESQINVIKGKLVTVNDLLDKVQHEINRHKADRVKMKGEEGEPNAGKVASRRSRP
jgi:chromosome segregation ATPase